MERTDFADLRVMLLSGKSHGALTLRSVLTLVGIVKLVPVNQSHRAIELLTMEDFDAVFAEDCCDPVDAMSFPLAVRHKHGIRNPMIPIFVFQERARRSHVEQARDTGATDFLTCPISPKTVMTKLKAALVAPRPFIKAPEFFGPDRRAKARPIWYGSDRRVRAPKKVQVEKGHMPPDSFLI